MYPIHCTPRIDTWCTLRPADFCDEISQDQSALARLRQGSARPQQFRTPRRDFLLIRQRSAAGRQSELWNVLSPHSADLQLDYRNRPWPIAEHNFSESHKLFCATDFPAVPVFVGELHDACSVMQRPIEPGAIRRERYLGLLA